MVGPAIRDGCWEWLGMSQGQFYRWAAEGAGGGGASAQGDRIAERAKLLSGRCGDGGAVCAADVHPVLRDSRTAARGSCITVAWFPFHRMSARGCSSILRSVKPRRSFFYGMAVVTAIAARRAGSGVGFRADRLAVAGRVSA
jgi:hypothetical protein